MGSEQGAPPGRILVVDDEPALLEATRDALEAEGFETVGHASSREALEELERGSYDALLTDLSLAGMDGIQLARAAVAIDSRIAPIVMTGHASIDSAVEAVKAGAFDYIAKPFKMKELLSRLRRALELRQLRLDNVQMREALAIRELALAIAGSLDFETSLERVAEAALAATKADQVGILLPSEEGSDLLRAAIVRSVTGHEILIESESLAADQSISAWKARSLEPILVEGPMNQTVDPASGLKPQHGHSFISLPMLASGALVGALRVSYVNSRSLVGRGELEALRVVAGIATPALQNARLFAQAREAEAKYRSIFENSLEGLFRAAPNGAVLDVNPALARLLGVNAPADPAESAAHFANWIADDGAREELKKHLAGERVAANFECQMKRADGSLVWASLSIRAVADASGEQSHFEGAVEDISSRKRAEENLKEVSRRREELERIVQRSPAVAFLRKAAPGWPVEFVSNNVSQFGYSPEDFLSGRLSYLDIVHPDDSASLLQEAAHPTRDSFAREYRVRDQSGRERWVDDRAWIARDANGAATHVKSIILDITERKRAERELNRQVERVRALRSIDTAILGSMDLDLTLSLSLERVAEQLEADAVDVLLLNPLFQTLECRSARGFRSGDIHRTKLRLGEGRRGRSALERRPLVVEDVGASKDFGGREAIESEEFVSYASTPLTAKGKFKGVLEVYRRSAFHPDPDWMEFFATLAGQVAVAIDNALMFEGLERSNMELKLAYDETLEGWVRALDMRDHETEQHTQRVTEMTMRLARRLGAREEELVHYRRGALLHDIGKMGVPDSILLKPGKLTDEEWVIMRKHPVYAYEFLAPIEFLKPALEIPYCHHEKWDGSGYPRRLQGDQIPLSARIFAIADVWDALTSDRPYRQAWPAEKVRRLILDDSGKHFDPRVVQAFLEEFQQGEI
jgi:PAS domain S-box-containing protein/putative nucleotidyltransferase with HDIG domain